MSVDLRAFDGAGDGVADNVIVQGTDAADRFDVGAASDGKVRVDGSGADVEVTSAEAQDNVDVDALGDADTVVSGVGVPGPGRSRSTAATAPTRRSTRAPTATTRSASPATAPTSSRRSSTGGGIVNHRAVESLDGAGPRRRRHDHRPERHRRR